MRQHTVKPGDTLNSIAESYLYSTAKASEIRIANNLSSDVVTVGQVLNIPDSKFQERKPYNFETIGILINDKDFQYFQNLSMKFDLDALAPTFSFSSPYEPEEPFKSAFEPFGYQDIIIYYKEQLMLTGMISSVAYELSSSNSIAVAGYGKAGLLQYMTVPTSLYPRQQKNISLFQIAEKYCDPFGVGVDYTDEAADSMNKQFKKTEIDPTERISSFLIKLAKQKGLIISTAPDGRLLFSKDNLTGKNPVFEITPGQYNIEASYDGAGVYSDYTALNSANRKTRTKTAKKKIDITELRHTTLMYSSDDDGNMTDFINSEIGRSIMESTTFSFTLPFWENADGSIFQPRDIITIEEPRIRIEQPTKFLIKSVTLDLSGSRTASIEVTPLSALNNEFERFWD